MTLVTLPRPWTPFANDFIGLTSAGALIIDASGEKYGIVLQVPKSGDIDTIRFRLATVTTGETLRAGIYTVDPATGLPTTTAYGGMAVGTVAVADTDDNSGKAVTLATPASAVAGDVVAVVIEFDSAVGNLGFTNINGWNGSLLPYLVTAPGGVWAKSFTAGPLIALGYDDGSYPSIPGCCPFTEAGFASVSFDVDTATDEYGVKFTMPVPARLIGAIVNVQTAAGSDFEFICYNGTTAVETLAVDGDNYGNGVARTSVLRFATPVTLAKDDARILAIRPTTTVNVALWRGALATSAQMDALFGPNFFSVQRVNQGAWDESSTLIAPFIVPLFDQLDDGAGGGGGAGAPFSRVRLGR